MPAGGRITAGLLVVLVVMIGLVTMVAATEQGAEQTANTCAQQPNQRVSAAGQGSNQASEQRSGQSALLLSRACGCNSRRSRYPSHHHSRRRSRRNSVRLLKNLRSCSLLVKISCGLPQYPATGLLVKPKRLVFTTC
jgi:hypothetical protein